MDDRRLGIVVNTPTPCSCWCCGNQRKFHGNGKDGLSRDELSDREFRCFENE